MLGFFWRRADLIFGVKLFLDQKIFCTHLKQFQNYKSAETVFNDKKSNKLTKSVPNGLKYESLQKIK